MSGPRSCGCCACLAGAGDHVDVANRPGLSALGYRIGTYGSFLDAMIRRLTIPVTGPTTGYSLHGLTTREAIGYLHALPGPIVGADLVEFNPVHDPTGLTATVAAKILKELLGKMIAA